MGTGAGLLAAVTVGHVDRAVVRDHDVARLVESVLAGGAHAGPAERHQQLALRAELHGDVAFAIAVWIQAVGALRVGDPDVALRIDVQSVRLDHEPGPEAGDEVALRVELEHRVEVEPGAGVAAAALGDPDVAPVPVHVDPAGRAPFTAIRQLRPVADG